MKNLKLLAYLFLGVSIMLTAPSCGDDDPIVLGPSVSITNSPTGDIAPGSVFAVTISVAKGDADLKAVTVYEDDVKVDLSRLLVNGVAAGANPKLVVGDDVDGFTWIYTITAHTNASTKSYSFEVSDDNNKLNEASVNISTTATPPNIILNGSNTILTAPASLVEVSLSITAGSNNLSTIAVYANGTLMAASNLFYKTPDSNGEFDNNPYDFPEADESLFDGSIYIRASNNSGVHTYTIEVTDKGGEISTLDLVFNVGTAIDMEFTAILVSNQSGPDKGGLDLDAGLAVAFNSAQAEIRDLGIDLNEPNETNWYQQIRGVNNASIRRPDSSQPEGFNYDAVDSKEAIIAAWDAGTNVTDPVANTDDIFIVKRDNDYFLLKVIEVIVTTNDNLDNYKFNVKQALQ